MRDPLLLAKGTELNRQARELWQESQALNEAEHLAAGRNPSAVSPDWVCPAGAPLRAEATALRARAKTLFAQAEGQQPSVISAPSTTGNVMPIPSASSAFSKSDIDAAIATALANMRTSAAADPVTASAETIAAAAAREAEARALEGDRLVASIIGNTDCMARITAERHAREAEAAVADAAGAERSARDAEVEKLTAQIVSA